MAPSKVLRALFVAYVTATLAHVGWIVAHEPFTFDAWKVAAETHARPFSLGHLFDYYRFEYTHSNPRIGQVLTYLAYKLEYFAVIATPLVYVAISLAITVLALGRAPWKRGRDLALWAFVIGAMWFALPELPKWMFSRAYAANYIYGCALQLWFLVPLRLAGGRASPAACAAFSVFGVAAGMCSEHTGPTLAAFLVGFAWWRGRATGERQSLAWAGAAGFIVGFAAILFAPGQGERYDGIVQKTGLFARLVQRGVIGNLDILRDLLVGVAPIVALIAIALVIAAADPPDDGARRRALGGIALAMLAAVAMAVTIFVSPKLGSRFYIFSACLVLAGFVALAETVLVTRRRLVPFVVIAVASSSYAGARTIPLYARAKRASDARLAALEAAPRDRVFYADELVQADESWWFLGDDLRESNKREDVARYFALPGVAFRQFSEWAPLGVAGARFVPHYTVEPAGCIDEHGGFGLGDVKGFDLAGVQREMKIAVEALRERLGAAGRLDQLDLAVELGDPNLALPRPRVLVGRWRPDRFEGYLGQLHRATGSFARDVIAPAELRTSDREVYVYLVGGEAKRLGLASDATLRYTPWGPGVYWIMVCDRAECFVIAATRQAS
jgi:hypothetical protein